jgi:hypothetical protein
VDGLEREYGARLRVERVDYNSPRGQALARRFLVRAHPSVLVIDRSGAASASITGVPTRAQLVATVEQVLGAAP